jgi:hypothetical protein
MKVSFSILFALSAFAFSGQVCAQFSQPPPGRSAPVCSEEKKGGSECKTLPLPAEITVSCQYYETGEWFAGMNCTASAWQYIAGTWSQIDPSLLKYYWASIVDGQEYYSAPMDSASATVFCGLTRQGYVRVSAADGTAITAFTCGYYDPPSGQ